MSFDYEELDCGVELDFHDDEDVYALCDEEAPSRHSLLSRYEYREWPEYHRYCERVSSRQELQDDLVRHFVINAISVFCFLRLPEILWARKFGK